MLIGVFIHHTLGHVCHCLTEHCVKIIHLELWNFADKLVKEVLTALCLFRTMLLDIIQNALQAVCGYHSMLRTYTHMFKFRVLCHSRK